MKLTLTDETLLPDLLSFLRKEGCVAYYEGGGVETVRPRSFGEQEAAEYSASCTGGETSTPKRRSRCPSRTGAPPLGVFLKKKPKPVCKCIAVCRTRAASSPSP
jgi:hypothetical protein